MSKITTITCDNCGRDLRTTGYESEYSMTPRKGNILRWLRKARDKLRPMPKKYTFADLRERVQDAISAKYPQLFIEEGSVTLIDGFMSQSIQPEFGGDVGLVIGGPIVPLVAVVGNRTGKMYYFALKALLPDIEI